MPSKCIQLRPTIPFTVPLSPSPSPLPFGNELQQLKSGFNFKKLTQKEPIYHHAISWKGNSSNTAPPGTVPHRPAPPLVQPCPEQSKNI